MFQNIIKKNRSASEANNTLSIAGTTRFAEIKKSYSYLSYCFFIPVVLYFITYLLQSKEDFIYFPKTIF